MSIGISVNAIKMSEIVAKKPPNKQVFLHAPHKLLDTGSAKLICVQSIVEATIKLLLTRIIESHSVLVFQYGV